MKPLAIAFISILFLYIHSLMKDSMDVNQWNAGQKMCELFGGAESIDSYTFGSETIEIESHCLDGKTVTKRFSVKELENEN